MCIRDSYRHDAAYAREQGNRDLYRASRRANIACKEAIEASLSEHYRDNRLEMCIRDSASPMRK